MKKLIFILIALASTTLLSCENFRDDNGDLGGMWQLTQWRTRNAAGAIDSLVANNIYNDTSVPNTRKIYYCIHRDLLQLEDASTHREYFYFCSFHYDKEYFSLGTVVDKKDSLIVDNNDPDKTYDALRSFGVPSNGKFHIDRLNADELVLSTANDILIFRKY